MKKIIIILSILSACLCLLFFIYPNDQEAPNKPAIAFNESVPYSTPKIEQKDLPRYSKYYVKPDMVPDGFQDFHNMKQGKRLNKVTELMKIKDLDEEYLEFFKAEIFNRAHMDTVRNNMANALCWQRNPDPELHLLFIKMLNDPGEDPVWRDYCIQFLSECYKSSSNKPLIIETFERCSKGKNPKAGTALLHLAYQERENDVALEENYSEQNIIKLADPKVHIDQKTSILTIIGMRKDIAQLSVLRKYAKQDETASLKSTAIGSLGLIGEEEDLVIINKALYHTNGRVVLAARAAKKKIEERMAKEK